MRPCNIYTFLKLKNIKQKLVEKKKKDIFLIVAQNVDSGYTLELPRGGGGGGGVLTSTHSLC